MSWYKLWGEIFSMSKMTLYDWYFSSKLVVYAFCG